MSVLPVLAESGTMGQQDQSMQRDECLLVAKLADANCPNHSMSLDERIDKLSGEISKGTDVYSPEELSYLNKELKAAKDIRDYVNNNNPSYAY
jgi:hypothetical protein